MIAPRMWDHMLTREQLSAGWIGLLVFRPSAWDSRSQIVLTRLIMNVCPTEETFPYRVARFPVEKWSTTPLFNP